MSLFFGCSVVRGRNIACDLLQTSEISQSGRTVTVIGCVCIRIAGKDGIQTSPAAGLQHRGVSACPVVRKRIGSSHVLRIAPSGCAQAGYMWNHWLRSFLHPYFPYTTETGFCSESGSLPAMLCRRCGRMGSLPVRSWIPLPGRLP